MSDSRQEFNAHRNAWKLISLEERSTGATKGIQDAKRGKPESLLLGVFKHVMSRLELSGFAELCC